MPDALNCIGHSVLLTHFNHTYKYTIHFYCVGSTHSTFERKQMQKRIKKKTRETKRNELLWNAFTANSKLMLYDVV